MAGSASDQLLHRPVSLGGSDDQRPMLARAGWCYGGGADRGYGGGDGADGSDELSKAFIFTVEPVFDEAFDRPDCARASRLYRVRRRASYRSGFSQAPPSASAAPGSRCLTRWIGVRTWMPSVSSIQSLPGARMSRAVWNRSTWSQPNVRVRNSHRVRMPTSDMTRPIRANRQANASHIPGIGSKISTAATLCVCVATMPIPTAAKTVPMTTMPYGRIRKGSLYGVVHLVTCPPCHDHTARTSICVHPPAPVPIPAT